MRWNEAVEGHYVMALTFRAVLFSDTIATCAVSWRCPWPCPKAIATIAGILTEGIPEGSVAIQEGSPRRHEPYAQ